VSTFSVGLAEAFGGPCFERLLEAFWIKLETAADATSLKSASVAARFTPPADVGTSGFLATTAAAVAVGAGFGKAGNLAVCDGGFAT